MLTVDFTVAKVRAQASFADLAPRLPEGPAVWSTDESAWPTEPGSPVQQLDRWIETGVGVGAPVRAVLGFCGSASLAAALAARIATTATAPMLVLFDPVTVGPRTMIDQAYDAIHRLGSLQQSDNGIDNGGDETGGADELDRLATRLAQRYAEAAATVGTSQKIPQSIVNQLCQRVTANLRFLTLAATAWSAPRLEPDLVVLSRDHEAPPDVIAALGRRTGTPDNPRGALVRLPVGQDDLLADAGATEAVARLFAEAAA